MRCPSCHSYIPEGLSEPIVCPQCGKKTSAPERSTPNVDRDKTSPLTPTAANAEPPPAPLPRPPLLGSTTGAASEAFAPFFTIQTHLSFEPARSQAFLRHPCQGSLSFGPDGFSVVFDEGRHWEKFLYREISAFRLGDDCVFITARDMESRLTLYHSWLPIFFSGPRKRRAKLAYELLGRVRSGLTPFEIAAYQNKLS